MFEKIKRLISSLRKLKYLVDNYEKLNNSRILEHHLTNISLSSNDRLIDSDLLTDRELIVSLTTYSKRIHDVHLVIESIGLQTVKPNRLILWLDEEEFTDDSIPVILKKQVSRGLEIKYCPNYRSYKKLIPTLLENNNANIITIDDDVLYPYDMIELLIKESLLYPECVIGHRVHQITFDDDDNINPYDNWKKEIKETVPSIYNVAIGVGGVFYPSGSLSVECCNIDTFQRLAPNADDIWFKAMSTINKVPTKKVNDERCFWNRFLLINTSQDIALSISNVTEGGNDEQIHNVFCKYDLFGLSASGE